MSLSVRPSGPRRPIGRRYGHELLPSRRDRGRGRGAGGRASVRGERADYCVAPNYDCGPNNVQKLQDALDLAASTQEADRVLLGAGTYVAPPVWNAFHYETTGSELEIAGAGRGQTVLTAQTSATSQVLSLRGAPGSSVHDLTVHIPAKAANSFVGLSTWNVARRIEITEDGPQTQDVYGVVLKGDAALEDASVRLSSTEKTIGVMLDTSLAASVTGSSIVANTGIRAFGHADIARSRVSAGNTGIQAYTGNGTVRDSLVRVIGTGGMGIVAENTQSSTGLTADGVTVVGPDTLDFSGISAYSKGGWNQAVEVAVANSVIRGGLSSLFGMVQDAGSVKISTSYSDYNLATT